MRIVPGSHRPDPAPVRPVGPPPELRDQLTDAMPHAVLDLLERPESGDVQIGSHTLGGALADSLRFRFVGAGALKNRMIVGENASAAALLTGERGSAVRDALTGILHVFGDRGQQTKMAGVTMAANRDAFLGNLLISTAEQLLASGERVDPEDLVDIADELEGAGIDQAYGVYDGVGWMHLDPSTSREFHERIAAGPTAPVQEGELVATLQHELEHSVTPSNEAEFRKVPWLEEATAELLTQWNGAIGDLAAGMGIRQKSSGVVAYQPQVRELEKWVRRTGLDPAKHEDLSAVRTLLQDTSVGHVPRKIAEAIVAREGAGDTAALETSITKAFGASAFEQVVGTGIDETDPHGSLNRLDTILHGSSSGSGMQPLAARAS